MTPEIYEAMKRRISIEPDIDEETREMLRMKPLAVTVYHFNAEGLNEGLESWDPNYVDGILHPMSTRNLWNVCQRFYSFINHYENIDQRLLNKE